MKLIKKMALVALLPITLFSSENYLTRPAPVVSEINLDQRKSTFRQLQLDCTERSKSLACHRLGVYYLETRLNPEGLSYLNAACELGRGYSCTLAGKYYEAGDIITQDLPKAKSYYNKGCLRESKEGCKRYSNVVIQPAPKKITSLDTLRSLGL